MRIAGIDIGGMSTKIGVLDEKTGFSPDSVVPTRIGEVERMADDLAEIICALTVDRVGVGTAGAVNHLTGLVDAGNLYWFNAPLQRLLQDRLDVPVWVDNDANAALAAEWYDGACTGAQNAVYLTLGTGIGGALLLNGRPWRGHTNTAGELGHIITHADGLKCTCSRRGCLEMYASATALSRMGGGIPAKEIIDAARDGDAQMRKVFDQYIHELGIGLVSLIMVFNPEVIVLGGGISRAGEFLLTNIRAEIDRQYERRRSYFTGEIRLAAARNDAGMIGAAVLAKNMGL